MADGGRQDVLGQKAQAAQRAFEARGMSPAKALRRALARTADILWDLALVCQGVQLETLDQDGVIDRLDEETLLILLDGPNGSTGVAEVDREILTGIVEVQTIQQVTTLPIEERPLTATDAAMTAPLIDGALKGFPALLEEHPLRPQLEGYRFGARIEDTRSVTMVLEAPSYRAFHATIDLAVGRRRGKLSFFLPERVIEVSQEEATATSEAPGPHAELMMRLPASLDCVLAKLVVPLRQVHGFKPGDLLTLPDEAGENVELIASKGLLVAKGALGQNVGHRALRITWPPAQDTTAPQGLPLADPGLSLTDSEMPNMDFDGMAEAEEALPALDGMDGLGDFGGMDAAGDGAMADFELPDLDGEALPELPDLPDMDFDGGDLDFDAIEGLEGGDEGFGSAPLDLDIE